MGELVAMCGCLKPLCAPPPAGVGRCRVLLPTIRTVMLCVPSLAN